LLKVSFHYVVCTRLCNLDVALCIDCFPTFHSDPFEDITSISNVSWIVLVSCNELLNLEAQFPKGLERKNRCFRTSFPLSRDSFLHKFKGNWPKLNKKSFLETQFNLFCYKVEEDSQSMKITNQTLWEYQLSFSFVQSDFWIVFGVAWR